MISYNAKIWIWISQALGYNNYKVGLLSRIYSDINDFYSGGEREWRISGVLTPNDINRLASTPVSVSEKILSKCGSLGYSVLAVDDDEAYPEALRCIECPPAVLYVSGTLPDIDNRLTIGIVGTRNATNYGTTNSYKIAYSLARCGVAVISGGALGVDSASHKGCLAADGVTVCVLGCGINTAYLPKNAPMRRAITKRGAVISEYPPDVAARGYHFPARNRIIAALSDGVLVIEAGVRSGSLITADYAGETGKKVFALVGNNSPQNEGSNGRIKDGLAIPVTGYLDVINSFDSLYVTRERLDFDVPSDSEIEKIIVKGELPSKHTQSGNTAPLSAPRPPKAAAARPSANVEAAQKAAHEAADKPKVKKPCPEGIGETAQKVYDYIGFEPVHIDKISSDLNIPAFKLLPAISKLEIRGLITALEGRRYVIK